MASPIIKIDVDSEPFKKFKDLFDKYRDAVKDANTAWEGLAAASAAALSPLSDYADRATTAHGRLNAAILRTDSGLKGASKTAAGFAKTIEHITKSVIAWTTVTAGIGFFGLDRLAAGVLDRQKSAAGLGISIGQQSSFRANMSPTLGSPDSVLSAIANAQQDPQKWGALLSMGVSQQASPFEASMQAMSRARQLWMEHPNVAYAQARGLTEFFSVEDLRRMAATPDAKFRAQQDQTRRDVGALGFGASQTDEWTKLSVSLHKAGLEIERVLVDGLGPLTPALGKLSGAVVKAIDDFFKSGEAKEGIDALAAGVKEFAGYLSSQQFRTDVRTFVDDFEAVAHATAAAMKWMGLIPSGDAKGLQNNPWTNPSAGPGMEFGPDGEIVPKGSGDGKGGIWDRTKKGGADIWNWLQDAGKSYGLPSGMLNSVYGAESGRGRYLRSPKGALGPFQMMPATAAAYGVGNPMDLGESAGGAGRYLHDLIARFHGDTDKALAAYNWGPGNLSRDIAKHGSDWRSHLPKETRDYLDRIHKGQGDDATAVLRSLLRVAKTQRGRGGANISIDNNTSSQVAIQANGAI